MDASFIQNKSLYNSPEELCEQKPNTLPGKMAWNLFDTADLKY